MVKNIIYKGEYVLKNYIILNEIEQKIALDFRNINKEWMINKDTINYEDHKTWIKSLKNRTDTFYYLVFKNDIAFMSIDYHDINIVKKEAYWGYFLGNNNYKPEVLKIEKIIIDIAFKKLSIEKLLCINDVNNHVINIHKFFGFKEDKIIKIDNREFLQMYLMKQKT